MGLVVGPDTGWAGPWLRMRYPNVNIRIDPFATLVPKCQYSDRSICNIGTQMSILGSLEYLKTCSGRWALSIANPCLDMSRACVKHMYGADWGLSQDVGNQVLGLFYWIFGIVVYQEAGIKIQGWAKVGIIYGIIIKMNIYYIYIYVYIYIYM